MPKDNRATKTLVSEKQALKAKIIDFNQKQWIDTTRDDFSDLRTIYELKANNVIFSFLEFLRLFIVSDSETIKRQNLFNI